MRKPSARETVLGVALAGAIGASHYGRGQAEQPPLPPVAAKQSADGGTDLKSRAPAAPAEEPNLAPPLLASFERAKTPQQILAEKIGVLKQLVSWAVPVDEVQPPGAGKPSIAARRAADKEILIQVRAVLEFAAANKLTADDGLVAEWRAVAINARINQFHLTGAEIEDVLRRWERKNK